MQEHYNMASPMDHYAVLGVRQDADEVVITAAYRALAKKFHPDTGSHKGTASSKRFRRIQEAYDTLRDSQKRRDYDEAIAGRRASSTGSNRNADSSGRNSEPQQRQGQRQGTQAGFNKSQLQPRNPDSRALLKRQVLVGAITSIAIVLVVGLWIGIGQRVPELLGKPAPSIDASDKGMLSGPAVTGTAKKPLPQTQFEKPAEIVSNGDAKVGLEDGISSGQESASSESLEKSGLIPESGMPVRKKIEDRLIGNQEVLDESEPSPDHAVEIVIPPWAEDHIQPSENLEPYVPIQDWTPYQRVQVIGGRRDSPSPRVPQPPKQIQDRLGASSE